MGNPLAPTICLSMLNQQQNEYLTRVNKGQPAGELLRRYWMPAALSEELAGERPVVAVRLLGENLVLFRNQQGELGLIQRHCPHRGADLLYGRLENGGLRCVFHGWLFDPSGQCLEQPGEPESSQMYKQICAISYPVVEKNGIIFAYLGPGKAPAQPDLDCFRAPDTHVFAFKGLWQCNWLQALEVGIDPAHASFLHRFLEDEDPSEGYGKQFRDASVNTEIPMTRILREYSRPTIEVEPTDFGFRLITVRELDHLTVHVRVTNQVFPCAITIPMSGQINITQWHVPVDDTHCYWYAMFTSYGDPIDKATMREQRIEEHSLPLYQPLTNSDNHYHYDPEEQRNLTYTGMGMDINVHDQWACESMGAIQDRTDEHLAQSDKAIVMFRRLLKQMIERVERGETTQLPLQCGPDDLEKVEGPMAIDTVISQNGNSTHCWQDEWVRLDQDRRQKASWAAELTKIGKS